MNIEALFNDLKTKDIICWGSGKHFKNITYPFLCESGLIDNLKGFLDTTGTDEVILDKRKYTRIKKSDLYSIDIKKTVVLIAVTGYREIQTQLSGDPRLCDLAAIPAIFLESLYEDFTLLSVEKPQLNYRKNSSPVIPKIIHTFWFSDGKPLPEKYKNCLNTWKKYAPDFEIKIWDNTSYRAENCLFFEQAVERAGHIVAAGGGNGM